MNNKAIVYVDFGGSHISAIAGEVQENHALKIYGELTQPSDDCKNGLIEEITGASYKVCEITKLFQNSLRWKERISCVNLSVNAKSMRNQVVSVQRKFVNSVTDNLLKELAKEAVATVKNENIAVFQTIPLDYYVDEKWVENPIGVKGKVIHAHYNLILGHRLVRERINRTMQRTGIRVDHIHLSMEAIALAVLSDKEKNEGCNVINLGATTTSLGVYRSGKLQELLVVPFGGKNITRDIMEIGISYKNAEILKCKAGYAMEKFVENPVNVRIPAVHAEDAHVKISTSFLAVIIEARLTETLSPIFSLIDTIDYPLAGGIILTGGAAKLRGLEQFVSEKTGLQVRIGDHSEWLSNDTDPKFFAPEYTQAVGALLLSNDLYEANLIKEPAIEIKIPEKNVFSRISKHISTGIGLLFDYDEIERRQYETDNK